MRVERLPTGLRVEVDSEPETERLGRAIAEVAHPGLVVGLIGPLGAGKTRLVRSIAEALGADPASIGSPTFVLIHEYAGRMPIYHFDAYRLGDPEEFDAIGADEYFTGGGICLVEWADRVAAHLPREAWILRVEPEGERRRFVLSIGAEMAGRLRSALERPSG